VVLPEAPALLESRVGNSPMADKKLLGALIAAAGGKSSFRKLISGERREDSFHSLNLQKQSAAPAFGRKDPRVRALRSAFPPRQALRARPPSAALRTVVRPGAGEPKKAPTWLVINQASSTLQIYPVRVSNCRVRELIKEGSIFLFKI